MKRPSTDKERELDPVFTEAIAARDSDHLDLAKPLCNEIIAKLADTDRRFLAIVHSQLGYIHKLLGDLMVAEHHCRLSVHYAPTTELASLNLFHVFVEQGRWREALEEAIRYLTLRTSAEYRSLFEGEDFGKGFDAPTTNLLIEVRRLLKIHSDRN